MKTKNLTLTTVALALWAGMITPCAAKSTPKSKQLAQSAAEVLKYAAQKENDARQHQQKAQELNQRTSLENVDQKQLEHDKVVLKNYERAAKAVNDYAGQKKEKVVVRGIEMANNLAEAQKNLDDAMLDAAYGSLHSEAQKQTEAAEAAKKEACLAREYAAHLQKMSAQEAAKEKKRAAEKAAAEKKAREEKGWNSESGRKAIEKYNQELERGFDRLNVG